MLRQEPLQLLAVVSIGVAHVVDDRSDPPAWQGATAPGPAPPKHAAFSLRPRVITSIAKPVAVAYPTVIAPLINIASAKRFAPVPNHSLTYRVTYAPAHHPNPLAGAHSHHHRKRRTITKTTVWDTPIPKPIKIPNHQTPAKLRYNPTYAATTHAAPHQRSRPHKKRHCTVAKIPGINHRLTLGNVVEDSTAAIAIKTAATCENTQHASHIHIRKPLPPNRPCTQRPPPFYQLGLEHETPDKKVPANRKERSLNGETYHIIPLDRCKSDPYQLHF
jgi:hypothetical protein